ncbi:MAG: diguanylate cyclase [Deltaproteobacteria bacterium]|nr:MAG: diguanylate cyclase [Deltaproteobacteria bacterium]
MIRKSEIFNRYSVDFPPDLSPSDVEDIGKALNALLKTPAVIGFGGKEEFYAHFVNHVMTMDLGVRDIIFYTYDDELGKYIPSISGEINQEKVDDLFVGFLDPKSLEEVRKPIKLTRGRKDVVEELLRNLDAGCGLIIPLFPDGSFRGCVAFLTPDGVVFEERDVKVLWNLAFYVELFLKIQESSRSLLYYAFYDPLTSLFNRRAFNERLEQEVLKSRRTGRSFSLLMADIDNFKEYNDRFHHPAGDITLQEVAEIIRESVREIDTVARLGGDEFGIILSGTGSSDSLVVAHRILGRVSTHLFPDENFDKTQKVTLSMGISVFPQDGFTGHDLVKRADEALFLAKKLGGNRVIRTEDAALMRIAPTQATHDIPPQSLYEAVRTVFNFEKFMEVLLHISLDALQAERGSLFVREWGDPDYVLLAKKGFSTNGNGRVRKIYGGNIIRLVAEKGQPLISEKSPDEEVKKYLMREGFYNESFISIPLIHGGDVVGVLNISNKRGGGTFSRDDLKKIEPLLSQVTTILMEGLRFRKNLRTFGEISLATMFDAFELKYPFYRHHSSDVAELSGRIARAMGLGREREETIRVAGRLHDVGMLCVPSSIMTKERDLSETERDVVRKHPFVGWKMLENYPELDEVRDLVLYHHERYDGSGYPFGLKGDDIPIEASVLSLAEFFTSVTSERPHRPPLSRKKALEMVKDLKGRAFAPEVVDSFLKIAS